MSLLKLQLPQKPMPIVVIGAGGIVHDAHLPAYRKAGFTIAAIYDPDQERARSLADKFAIDHVSASLEDAVKNVPHDAIFDVATPPAAFVEILKSLPDGSNVLLQKPMGVDLSGAREIRQICREKRLRAAVNFQLRYAPAVRTARYMIADGAIGDLHDMEVRVTVYTPWHLWTFLERMPRMEILNHSIHYIDLMRSFLGEPESVFARTVKHPKMKNLASTRSNIILDYGDTLRANITTNHGHEFGLRHQESYIKWEGTQGAIKIRAGLLMDYPKGVPDAFEYCALEPGKPPEWRTIEIQGSWFPDAFIGTMADLMCYAEGSASYLPGSVEDAFKTMAVVEAAYASNDAGGARLAND